MDLSQGSDGFIFMSSLFKYMKAYASVKDSTEYWDGVFEDGEKLIKEFQASSDVALFSEIMVMAFIDYLEKEFKRKCVT